MVRTSNVVLVLMAVEDLDKGRGVTTTQVYKWLHDRKYDSPPPRSIAQILATVPGAVIQGRRKDAYVRWYRGPLLRAALRDLGAPSPPRSR